MIPIKAIEASVLEYLVTNLAFDAQVGNPVQFDKAAPSVTEWVEANITANRGSPSRANNKEAEIRLDVVCSSKDQTKLYRAHAMADAVVRLFPDRFVLKVYDWDDSEAPVLGEVRWKEPTVVDVAYRLWQSQKIQLEGCYRGL